ncbi:Nucleotide-binding universal stress protein, UspA family [Polaromonas sp. OV174]|uniref:universal stress protein n=1 Tax=Polaromonas sp. OV174 TaxID=1855300 RepID=UPI0008E8C29D|nr:universal stress protein [Polaromonas sp. OV174]SFC26240.1 Nucleotide-binding universal stress protein, UspA family [Polaromonas sp. OV174]
MKILFAADGSKFTKKALAFLVTHESLAGPEDELVVLNVQPPVPPRVKTMVGAATVNAYHRDEANRVLEPIERFLKRHKMQFHTAWVVGIPAMEVIRAATREQAHMIVMGTHGHDLLGRAIMGSVAQRVVTDSEIPVLLVK